MAIDFSSVGGTSSPYMEKLTFLRLGVYPP